MKTIATSSVEGPESNGNAKIVQLKDGTFQLQLTNFWVAPGAPDVRIVFSENIDVHIDDSIRFISALPIGNFEQNITIEQVDFKKIKTLIVYCKKFHAHFGHGNLNML